jgi:hypothetical protein
MNEHLYHPDPDQWEDQWTALVRIKEDFIALANTMALRITDSKLAREKIIDMEQGIDDALWGDEKHLKEFFQDDRQLPRTNVYQKWLDDSKMKKE